MKIAHLDGFAGVAWRLAEAQRRLGHEATVFCLRETPYRFPYDVRLSGTEGPLGWNAVMFANWRTFANFDVVHVHGGIWRAQVFYPFFKRRYGWKTLVAHMHGSETRTGKGLHHLGSADLIFHSTPDLAQWLPRSVWIPNPIDMPKLPPEPENPLPRFGHFASSRVNKGTEQVIALFKETFGPFELEKGGRIDKFRSKEAELWVVSQIPHSQALEVMAGCDAVIDQISPFGAYGMVAIEAMALGKPVLGTLKPEWYPDCPISSLQGDQARERLRAVATDKGLRRSAGAAGRAYVERVHESGKIARKVLEQYYAAQRVPALTGSQATSYWTRRGKHYVDEFATPAVQQRYDAQAEEVLEVLASLSFRSVAEVGCGFARVGRKVVERFGASWVGLDVSRAQLEAARRRFPSFKGSVVEASATQLPLASNSFDLVLSAEVLLHIPPDRIGAVAREMLRVSRRHVVHVDWYEDYMVGHQTGWCWAHDYPALWDDLGVEVRQVRLRSTGIQSVFVISKRESQGP